MNIKCPNKNLPEWKELVSVLGENQAYYLWDQNNGYGLDKAPNGQPSKLFSDLLSHYNGDEDAAILAKSKVFTEGFKTWFGDWLSDDKTNVSKVVDENGEPLVVYHTVNPNYDASFEVFNTSIEGRETMIYHTDDKEMSFTYAKNHKKFKTLDSVKNRLTEIPENIRKAEARIKDIENATEEYVKELGYESLSDPSWAGIVEYTRNSMNNVIRDLKEEQKELEDILNNPRKIEYVKADFVSLKNPLVIDGKSQNWNELSDNPDVDILAKIAYNNSYFKTKDSIRRRLEQEIINNSQGQEQELFQVLPFDEVASKEEIDNLNNRVEAELEKEFPHGPFELESTRTIEEKYRDSEYDGIIFNNIKDYGGGTSFFQQIAPHNVFVAKSSNQIKSVDNRGTFSTQDNNIYRRVAAGIEADNRAAMQDIGEFTSTSQLIDYLLASPDVSGATKDLLVELKKHSAKLIIEAITPDDEVAHYSKGEVVLYADRISNHTLQTTAEDLAHELLHHYLLNIYKTNSSFRNELDRLQSKYRQYWDGETLPYGLREQDSSDEFLNEFMSNQNFRAQLRKRSRNLFDIIKEAILQIINKLFGDSKRTVSFDQDLNRLQEEAFRLIGYVNEQDTVTNDDSIVHKKVIDDQINKTYDKIQKGLKNRLNAVKRYTTKNPNTWNRLQTIIQQLQNSEAEQGILQFIDHINDTIGDSIRFLNKPFDEINAKQVRQLSQDYVGFYKPLLDEINYLLDTTDIFKELPNYNEIRQEVTTLTNQMNTVNNRFTNIARAKGIQEVVSFLQEQGMPQFDIDSLVDYLNDPTTDTNIIQNWFGMASNSDNAIIRSIAKVLNDTKNQQERDVLEVGNRLIEILDKAKEKYGVDVQKLLYEKLDDGTYSGYRVKPLNYGQYKKDCTKFLETLADKLGITKDKEGQYVLPEDEDIQKKWFDSISEFYGKRAVRRYKAEYYTLRNKMLSMKTRDAINEIQNGIDTIVNPITIDGIEHVELLSEADYRQLLLLRRQKQLLANPYNLDGSVKTGVDAQIAKELTDFHNEVNKRVKYQADWDRYNKDLAKIEKQYRNNPDKIEQWKKRNTKLRLTQQFYDDLSEVEKIPQSKLYQELVDKRRQLHQLFTNPETGQIDVASLSDSERKALLDLDQAIADEYVGSSEERTGTKFSDIAEIVPTDEYYRDAELAKQNGVYIEWFKNNHYEDYRGQIHPASYYTRLKPLDEAKYTEIAPIGKYTQLDPTSEWYDDRFDPNGPSTQPSKEFYDNSKAYNAMASKPEVKALYDAIEEVMNASNNYISFLTFANDNRMPQIPARFMQVLMRNSSVLGKLKYVFSEFIETQPDDYDYVDDFATMPNGDPIKVIPTRFIKMLDDPNTISTDAVASVIAYYAMADNFRLMSQKQDVVELMLGLLRNLTISTRRGIKNPGDSNAYKQAQLLVDRLMYGRNKSPMRYNVFGKELNIGKALDLVRLFVTKVNLSGNLWSIATSFFTDATYTTLESKLGRFFNSKDLRFAVQEFNRQLPSMMANIGNPNPKGKLPFLMRLNQVVRDNRETYDRLDQSKVLRSINQNFWFMGYTQSDYTVKSHTLLSIYHNYRFVKGKGFMSQQEYIDEFYPTDRKKGAIAFDQLDVTLYDAYEESDNGEVKVSDKYKEFITDKLLNDVRNRIDILSRRIDGTMREVDKAQVHANSLASYLVMHRNFMISALHDRFKRRQYNLDLHMMEEGYYRSTGRFLLNVIKNRHFALTQLLADYDQLQEYEQYAVKKVANELILIAASTTVAVVLASMVDGDDDYDTWLNQAVTYVAMRSAFEFRTMYNPLEFMALIKSPTAAFTALDNASSLINLFNPASYVGDRTPFTIIDRGSYKGMPVILRNIIKVTPFRSIFEAGDPEAKRNYLQNQLMNF